MGATWSFTCSETGVMVGDWDLAPEGMPNCQNVNPCDTNEGALALAVLELLLG